MTRLQANREITEYLILAIETHPDLRFGQIMQMLGVIKPERSANPEQRISWQNEFYMESGDLLTRIMEKRSGAV